MIDTTAILSRVAEIVARAEKATPGPWGHCDDDTCKCTMVMSADHPVAEVTKGAWGDDFPSIRLVGESSLVLKAEAFMDQITYGEIPEKEFLANRDFVARARTDIPDMASFISDLVGEVERLTGELERCGVSRLIEGQRLLRDRDAAEQRAAAADALLREAWEWVDIDTGLVARIYAHLSAKEPTP